MHVVARGQARTMPWKNGGGSTQEIALSPADAALDAFDWRASIATIARNGPFSCFEGVDRVLVLLEGQGIDLDVADARTRLAARFEAVTFRGEAPAVAALIDGPTRDFNFMWRRAAVSAHVTVERAPVAVAAAQAIVCHVADGRWMCTRGAAAPVELAAGDTLVADGTDAHALALAPAAASAVAIVAVVQDARA